MEARGALREAIRHTGKLSGATGEMLGTLVKYFCGRAAYPRRKKFFKKSFGFSKNLNFLKTPLK
jgi:membrane protein DedA with SNARE-associated domain